MSLNIQHSSPVLYPISIKKAVKASLLAFLILRLSTLLIAWGAVQFKHIELPEPTAPPRIANFHDTVVTSQGIIRALIDPWYRWDAVSYLHIAYWGYQPDNVLVVFSPLYPYTVRLLAPLFGSDYLLTAILVSNLCCFMMFVLFYSLVARHYGDALAFNATIIYAIFPSAYFLVAPYTESMFLMLVIAAWLAVEMRRYWLAGLLGFLAALARTQSVLIVFPFIYMAYVETYLAKPDNSPSIRAAIQYYLRNFRQLLQPLPALLGVIFGVATYIYGLPLLGLMPRDQALQLGWGGSTVALIPGAGVWPIIVHLLTGRFDILEIRNLIVFIVLVWICYLTFKRLSLSFGIYALACVVLFSILVNAPEPLQSIFRFTLHVFPMFIVLAFYIRRKAFYGKLYMALSFAMLAAFTILFAWSVWTA